MPRFEKSLEALALIRLLQSRRAMTNRQVAREMGWRMKKAQRMTEMLSFNSSETGLFTMINTAKEGERVQSWHIKRSKLPVFSLDEDEIAFLLTLLGNPDNHHPSGPLKTDAISRKLRSQHPESGTYRFEEDLDFMLSTTSKLRQPRPYEPIAPTIYRELLAAIQSWHVLNIKYRKSGESNWIKVYPLGLLHGERNYLVVQLDDNPLSRCKLRLNEILEIKTTNEVFVIGEENFDMPEYMSAAFGVFQNNQIWKVVWTFDMVVSTEVAGYQFHHSQKVEQFDDGRTRVRFTASGLVEMCHELFKWGNHVKIESPPELQEMYDDMRLHKWSRWETNPWETKPWEINA